MQRSKGSAQNLNHAARKPERPSETANSPTLFTPSPAPQARERVGVGDSAQSCIRCRSRKSCRNDISPAPALPYGRKREFSRPTAFRQPFASDEGLQGKTATLHLHRGRLKTKNSFQTAFIFLYAT
ncbi:hypothetical protein HMPREF9120_01688 [Neisseria sp. oral taxon 020 str. F0370]|nr:hypothetical protein HMPREF9120_01688 [Neisseria sp. oral taxon 020 str. F0370]